MNTGNKMQKRIEEYNTVQLEERKDLPNLFEAIRQSQQGDMEVIKMFFYGYKMIERYPYEGKMQAYEVNKVQFWDKPTNIFLSNIKKKYCKNISTNEMSGFAGRKMAVKVNVSKFDEDEIDSLFYEYMVKLVGKIDLSKFVKDTESKTLNAIRKYIRVDFENNFLKAVHNERLGIERKTVDGVVYYVKTKPEEVLFDDIYVGRDEDGEQLHFLDVISYQDVNPSMTLEDAMYTPKKFIEENLEDALTDKQLEKWNKLMDYVKEEGIDRLIDSYTGKVKKSEISRILFPHRKTTSTVREIDAFIESINKRLEKKLDEAGMKYTSRDEELAKENKVKDTLNGAVTTYTGGLSEEDVERYFERHIESILKAHIDGRLTWDRGTDAMLPSLESMQELPFDVHEKWVNGGFNTKKEIIREWYNPEKFKLKASPRTNVKVVQPTVEKELNEKFITPDQLKEIRKESKR